MTCVTAKQSRRYVLRTNNFIRDIDTGGGQALTTRSGDRIREVAEAYRTLRSHDEGE